MVIVNRVFKRSYSLVILVGILLVPHKKLFSEENSSINPTVDKQVVGTQMNETRELDPKNVGESSSVAPEFDSEENSSASIEHNTESENRDSQKPEKLETRNSNVSNMAELMQRVKETGDQIKNAAGQNAPKSPATHPKENKRDDYSIEEF